MLIITFGFLAPVVAIGFEYGWWWGVLAFLFPLAVAKGYLEGVFVLVLLGIWFVFGFLGVMAFFPTSMVVSVVIAWILVGVFSVRDTIKQL